MTSLKMDSFASTLQKATTAGTPDLVAPGIVCFVTDDKGNELYQTSSGTLGLNRNSPCTPETLMWIASETKIITAACVMKLFEEGKLNLDEPVEDILPELKDLPITDTEGKFTKDKAENKITLRQLLTHTSGITYPPMHPGVAKCRADKGLTGEYSFFNDKFEDFHAGPLIFEPGQGFSYSTGIDWAGFYIERITKKSLEEYTQENFFKPLGMNTTTFDATTIDKYEEKLISMTYYLPGGGGLVDGPLPVVIPPLNNCGGHGIFSTPADYIKFLTMLLRDGAAPDGTQLLKKETIDEMFRPQLEGAALEGLKAAAASDIMRNIMLPGMEPDCPINHGLSGLINLADIKDRRKSGSMCWGGLPNLVWWIDRKSGITGNLSTQLLPTAEKPITKIIVEFEKEVYKELVA